MKNPRLRRGIIIFVDNGEIGGYNIIVSLHPQGECLHRPDRRTVGLCIVFLRLTGRRWKCKNGLPLKGATYHGRRKKGNSDP